ncbi:TetR/AcrR family transcriptional regulator [Actinomyces procaprae]|uniref:TetR/AcrR family transcriptional regulator n=1 Tax=Actinomyces procaprae TaxID=2560010 RepID=UPI00109DA4C0|nr:TetR/AcrR family transcriptional regulator [Actinomyces procaprae]
MRGREDLRVVKTRANIQATFVKLLAAKGFRHVTVQDILDDALINRTTFYRHYSSKYDLADKMAAEFLARFAAALDSAREDRASGIAAVYAVLVEDRDRTMALWDLRTHNTDVRAEMELVLRKAYPMLAGVRPRGGEGFPARVFSAIALAAFGYVLEGGDQHSMDDVRAGMREYITASTKVLSAFE